MFRRLLSFVRRWTGSYPVTAHIEGTKEEPPGEPESFGNGHVRLPDGTWIHGTPRGGGGGA